MDHSILAFTNFFLFSSDFRVAFSSLSAVFSSRFSYLLSSRFSSSLISFSPEDL